MREPQSSLLTKLTNRVVSFNQANGVDFDDGIMFTFGEKARFKSEVPTSIQTEPYETTILVTSLTQPSHPKLKTELDELMRKIARGIPGLALRPTKIQNQGTILRLPQLTGTEQVGTRQYEYSRVDKIDDEDALENSHSSFAIDHSTRLMRKVIVIGFPNSYLGDWWLLHQDKKGRPDQYPKFLDELFKEAIRFDDHQLKTDYLLDLELAGVLLDHTKAVLSNIAVSNRRVDSSVYEGTTY